MVKGSGENIGFMDKVREILLHNNAEELYKFLEANIDNLNLLALELTAMGIEIDLNTLDVLTMFTVIQKNKHKFISAEVAELEYIESTSFSNVFTNRNVLPKDLSSQHEMYDNPDYSKIFNSNEIIGTFPNTQSETIAEEKFAEQKANSDSFIQRERFFESIDNKKPNILEPQPIPEKEKEPIVDNDNNSEKPQTSPETPKQPEIPQKPEPTPPKDESKPIVEPENPTPPHGRVIPSIDVNGIEVLTDKNRDGKINKSEINGGDIGLKITLPTGTKEGDKITIDMPDGSKIQRELNKTDIDTESVILEGISLKDGSSNLKIKLTDENGQGEETNLIITIDTKAPNKPNAITIIDDTNKDGVISRAEDRDPNRKSDISFEIDSSVKIGDKIIINEQEVYIVKEEDIAKAKVILKDIPLNEGLNNLKIEIEDTAGNRSDSVTFPIRLSTFDPNLLSHNNIIIKQDTNKDNLLNRAELGTLREVDLRIVLPQSISKDDTIKITDAEGTQISTNITESHITDGFLDVSNVKISDGNNEIKAQIIKSNSEMGKEVSKIFKVDTTEPNSFNPNSDIKIVDDTNSDNKILKNEDSNNDKKTDIKITIPAGVEVGDRIILTSDNGKKEHVVIEDNLQGDRKITIRDFVINEGNNLINIKIVDNNGVEWGDIDKEFLVDTTNPVALTRDDIRFIDDTDNDGKILKNEDSNNDKKTDVEIKLPVGVQAGDKIIVQGDGFNDIEYVIKNDDLSEERKITISNIVLTNGNNDIAFKVIDSHGKNYGEINKSIILDINNPNALDENDIEFTLDTNKDGYILKDEDINNNRQTDIKIAIPTGVEVGDKIVIKLNNQPEIEHIIVANDLHGDRKITFNNIVLSEGANILNTKIIDTHNFIHNNINKTINVDTIDPSLISQDDISLSDDTNEDGKITYDEDSEHNNLTDIKIKLPDGVQTGDKITVKNGSNNEISYSIKESDLNGSKEITIPNIGFNSGLNAITIKIIDNHDILKQTITKNIHVDNPPPQTLTPNSIKIVEDLDNNGVISKTEDINEDHKTSIKITIPQGMVAGDKVIIKINNTTPLEYTIQGTEAEAIFNNVPYVDGENILDVSITSNGLTHQTIRKTFLSDSINPEAITIGNIEIVDDANGDSKILGSEDSNNDKKTDIKVILPTGTEVGDKIIIRNHMNKETEYIVKASDLQGNRKITISDIELQEGNNNLTIMVLDSHGTQHSQISTTIKLDTIIPGAIDTNSVIITEDINSDGKILSAEDINGDHITSMKITLPTGIQVGDKIEIDLNGVKTTHVVINDNLQGNREITLNNIRYAEGSNTAAIKIIDDNDITLSTLNKTFIVDTINPANLDLDQIAINKDINSDGKILSNEDIAKTYLTDVNVTLPDGVEQGDKIVVISNGKEFAYTVSQTDTAGSIVTVRGVDYSPLPTDTSNIKTITFKVRDLHGQEFAETTKSIEVDLKDPANIDPDKITFGDDTLIAPNNTIGQDGKIIGSENDHGQKLTNIRITDLGNSNLEPGDIIYLREPDGVQYSYMIPNTGFTGEVIFNDIPYKHGDNAYQLKIVDRHGNEYSNLTKKLIVDAVDPQSPTEGTYGFKNKTGTQGFIVNQSGAVDGKAVYEITLPQGVEAGDKLKISNSTGFTEYIVKDSDLTGTRVINIKTMVPNASNIPNDMFEGNSTGYSLENTKIEIYDKHGIKHHTLEERVYIDTLINTGFEIRDERNAQSPIIINSGGSTTNRKPSIYLNSAIDEKISVSRVVITNNDNNTEIYSNNGYGYELSNNRKLPLEGLSNLADGNYTISITTKDSAYNTQTITKTFSIQNNVRVSLTNYVDDVGSATGEIAFTKNTNPTAIDDLLPTIKGTYSGDVERIVIKINSESANPEIITINKNQLTNGTFSITPNTPLQNNHSSKILVEAYNEYDNVVSDYGYINTNFIPPSPTGLTKLPNGDIELTMPSGEHDKKVTIMFTDITGVERSVDFIKNTAGKWIKNTAYVNNEIPAVSTTDNGSEKIVFKEFIARGNTEFKAITNEVTEKTIIMSNIINKPVQIVLPQDQNNDDILDLSEVYLNSELITKIRFNLNDLTSSDLGRYRSYKEGNKLIISYLDPSSNNIIEDIITISSENISNKYVDYTIRGFYENRLLSAKIVQLDNTLERIINPYVSKQIDLRKGEISDIIWIKDQNKNGIINITESNNDTYSLKIILDEGTQIGYRIKGQVQFKKSDGSVYTQQIDQAISQSDINKKYAIINGQNMKDGVGVADLKIEYKDIDISETLQKKILIDRDIPFMKSFKLLDKNGLDVIGETNLNHERFIKNGNYEFTVRVEFPNDNSIPIKNKPNVGDYIRVTASGLKPVLEEGIINSDDLVRGYKDINFSYKNIHMKGGIIHNITVAMKDRADNNIDDIIFNNLGMYVNKMKPNSNIPFYQKKFSLTIAENEPIGLTSILDVGDKNMNGKIDGNERHDGKLNFDFIKTYDPVNQINKIQIEALDSQGISFFSSKAGYYTDSSKSSRYLLKVEPNGNTTTEFLTIPDQHSPTIIQYKIKNINGGNVIKNFYYDYKTGLDTLSVRESNSSDVIDLLTTPFSKYELKGGEDEVILRYPNISQHKNVDMGEGNDIFHYLPNTRMYKHSYGSDHNYIIDGGSGDDTIYVYKTRGFKGIKNIYNFEKILIKEYSEDIVLTPKEVLSLLNDNDENTPISNNLLKIMLDGEITSMPISLPGFIQINHSEVNSISKSIENTNNTFFKGIYNGQDVFLEIDKKINAEKLQAFLQNDENRNNIIEHNEGQYTHTNIYVYNLYEIESGDKLIIENNRGEIKTGKIQGDLTGFFQSIDYGFLDGGYNVKHLRGNGELKGSNYYNFTDKYTIGMEDETLFINGNTDLRAIDNLNTLYSDFKRIVIGRNTKLTVDPKSLLEISNDDNSVTPLLDSYIRIGSKFSQKMYLDDFKEIDANEAPNFNDKNHNNLFYKGEYGANTIFIEIDRHLDVVTI